MRIVQVCPKYHPDIGGVETHVRLISEKLVSAGFDVEVVCTTPSGEVLEENFINGVKIKRFRSFAPNDAYFLAPQIYLYLRKNKYDIIHAHNYHAFPALFAALAKAKSKFVFTPHTFGFTKKFPRNIFHRVYKPLGEYIFSSASKIISISKVEYDWIRSNFKVCNKIVYIPLPIEVEKQKKEQNLKLKQKLIEKNGDLKIVFSGRLSWEKNVHVLISAFKKIGEKFPRCALYIIGDGPNREHLEKIAFPANNIYFTGFLPHNKALNFIKECSIFVLPSKFEVSPISVFEAMALEVPVVVTPVGELPHVLKDGKNCIFVSGDNSADLAEKILKLIENRKFAKKVARNGREFVERRHEVDKIIKHHIKLYESINK